jgi:hypothetical protein
MNRVGRLIVALRPHTKVVARVPTTMNFQQFTVRRFSADHHHHDDHHHDGPAHEGEVSN